MKKRKRFPATQKRWIALAIAVLLLVIEWVILHSATFARCIADQAGQRAEQQQQLPPFLLALAHDLGFWLACNAYVVYEARDIFTVISTVLLALFTYRLWTGTDATLAHLQESSHQELRAYVFVFEVTPTTFDHVDPLTAFASYGLVVKNSGRTPAYDVTVLSRVDLAPPNVGAMTFPDLPLDTNASRAPLGPDSTVTHYLQHAMWTPAQRALLDAGHVPYLHGIIRYEDAFGNEWWTRFRQVRDKEGHGFTACEEGNEAKRTRD